MYIMCNLLSDFDEKKVNIRSSKYGSEIVWYDVTDIIARYTSQDNSLLEYVEKAEMEMCCLSTNHYQGEEVMKYVREKFEQMITVDEYDRFMCCSYKEGELDLCNDARQIRLTFKNGAVLIAHNSEWGSIELH